MNETLVRSIEQLGLNNLNIDLDYLTTKYPLPLDVVERHENAIGLLTDLGVSRETQIIVRAAAVLGDMPFAADDSKKSLSRSEVIPNIVTTVRSVLDLAKSRKIDVRLEINSSIHYLDNVKDHDESALLDSDNLTLEYCDETLNPAVMYLKEARQILS